MHPGYRTAARVEACVSACFRKVGPVKKHVVFSSRKPMMIVTRESIQYNDPPAYLQGIGAG